MATVMIISTEKDMRSEVLYLLSMVPFIVPHTLCVFEIGQENTRLRYAILHCIMYVENIVMAVLFYTATPTQEFWYGIPCMVAILLGYIVGVFFQVVFYLRCHPYQKVKCYVPCADLQLEYD